MSLNLKENLVTLVNHIHTKMDLFKDIKRGKRFTKSSLKKEAAHELKELGGMKKAEAFEKALKNKMGHMKQK